ncbi:MAG: DUF4388 domain-containing protein [Acidobacteriota bacterium]
MKVILGRLADIALPSLFKLLESAEVTGALELDCGGRQGTLWIRGGEVAGAVDPEVLRAAASRSGSFCFRPGALPATPGHWESSREVLARLDAERVRLSLEEVGQGVELAGDPLADLRSSLEQVHLPSGSPTVAVVTADPRPYRHLEPVWTQRGWTVAVEGEVAFPSRAQPDLLILHLPSSGTMAGQAEVWLNVVRAAAACQPPVPVLWVGGLSDPAVRHQAVMLGVEFLLPGPLSEGGEAGRWFREELTVLAERTLARRGVQGRDEAESLRDFFLALHVDAPPAEVRASLLRLAGDFFQRGVLLAVGEHAFESLGAYGFIHMPAARLPRGLDLLEDAVVARSVVPVAEGSAAAQRALAHALAAGSDLGEGVVVPVLLHGESVALFVGDGPARPDGRFDALAALLSRAGGMLGL